MVALRSIIAGVGAIGAAGAAGVTVLSPNDLQHVTATEGAAPGYEFCLKSDLPFFEGVDARCYDDDGLGDLRRAQVLNNQGEPVAVAMAHPTDMSMAPAACRTCDDYREMRFDGRYALTTREMRREAYFVRACGLIDALAASQPAGDAYFTDGAPTPEQIAAIAVDLQFAEAPVEPDADRGGAPGPKPDEVVVGRSGAHQWTVSVGDQIVALHELANADFDGDDVEEILTFTAVTPLGATAVVYTIGLLERDGPDMPVRFTVLTFDEGQISAVGG